MKEFICTDDLAVRVKDIIFICKNGDKDIMFYINGRGGSYSQFAYFGTTEERDKKFIEIKAILSTL